MAAFKASGKVDPFFLFLMLPLLLVPSPPPLSSSALSSQDRSEGNKLRPLTASTVVKGTANWDKGVNGSIDWFGNTNAAAAVATLCESTTTITFVNAHARASKEGGESLYKKLLLESHVSKVIAALAAVAVA